MNAATVWMLPWRSTSAGTRWVTVALMVLVWVMALALQHLQQRPGNFWIPSFVAAYGELFVGAFLLAPGLLLAIDARQLCVPRVQQQIVLGIILHAAVWIAIPSLLLIMAGGSLAMAIGLQTAGLVAGLALGLLPQALVVIAFVAPTCLSLMKLHVPHPTSVQTPAFWMVVAALLLVCVFCWQRYLRMADPYRTGFGTPFAIRICLISRYGWKSGHAWFLPSENPQQIRSKPKWLRVIPQLRDAGPRYPIHSLRIALGGWLMPQTSLSLVIQWSFVVLPVAALLAVFHMYSSRPISDIWHLLPFNVYAWLAGFTTLMLGLLATMLVQQRWSKPNGEVSVLALLPGLGKRTSLVKNVLCASLLPTFYLQLVIAVLVMLAAALQHPSLLDMAMVALTQLAALAFAPAFTAAAIGGRALPPWVAGLTVGVSFSLVGIGTGASAATSAAVAHSSMMIPAVITIWLILLGFLGWLGTRGWHGLQQRPHPFLAG